MSDSIHLSAAQAAFIESGVVIVIAASDASLLSSQSFGLGCRIASDGNRLTVFVAPSKCAALLDFIRQSGTVAVVFCQACSHLTLQIKGDQAVIRRLEESDHEALPIYLTDLVAELQRVGEKEAFVRTVMAHEPEDIAAIEFRPTAIYTQTPGPQAGAQIASGDLAPGPARHRTTKSAARGTISS
jgi:hypothetical protein